MRDSPVPRSQGLVRDIEHRQDVFLGPVLCKRHCTKLFTLFDAFNLHNNPEVGINIIPISKIKRLRHEVSQLASHSPGLKPKDSGFRTCVFYLYNKISSME